MECTYSRARNLLYTRCLTDGSCCGLRGKGWVALRLLAPAGSEAHDSAQFVGSCARRGQRCQGGRAAGLAHFVSGISGTAPSRLLTAQVRHASHSDFAAAIATSGLSAQAELEQCFPRRESSESCEFSAHIARS